MYLPVTVAPEILAQEGYVKVAAQTWMVECYLGDAKFKLVDCDGIREGVAMTGLGIFYTGTTFV